MTKLFTTRVLKDGRVETQRPERSGGVYWVEVPVSDEAEMERYAALGYSVRLRGEITGQWNLKKLKK